MTSPGSAPGSNGANRGGAAVKPQASGGRATGFARPLPTTTTARVVCDYLRRATPIGNPDRPVRAIGALSTHESGVLAFCDATRADGTTAAAVVIVPDTLAAMPRAGQTFIAADDGRGAFIDIVDALPPIRSVRRTLRRASTATRSSAKAQRSPRSRA
jgi:hypothetical protein